MRCSFRWSVSATCLYAAFCWPFESVLPWLHSGLDKDITAIFVLIDNVHCMNQVIPMFSFMHQWAFCSLFCSFIVCDSLVILCTTVWCWCLLRNVLLVVAKRMLYSICFSFHIYCSSINNYYGTMYCESQCITLQQFSPQWIIYSNENVHICKNRLYK